VLKRGTVPMKTGHGKKRKMGKKAGLAKFEQGKECRKRMEAGAL